MEDFMRRTETQFVEIQKFMEGSQQLHDEHRKALADQSTKTENQFLRLTEMLRSLMEKDRSPSVPVELETSDGQQTTTTAPQIRDNQKVEFAAMYVNGKADTWLQGILIQRPRIPWMELREAICARFGEKQGYEVVEEFNKLEQKDDLEAYCEKFEELRSYMLAYDPHLPESYFVSSFLSGLKPEIKSLVKISRPTSLAEALEHSRLHDTAVQAIVKLSKPPWRPSGGFSHNKTTNLDSKVTSNISTPSQSTTSLTPKSVAPVAESREARRAAGLCYRCGDKYFVGHRCKSQTLHSLLASQIDDLEEAKLQECEGTTHNQNEELPDIKPEVYVHALTGSSPLTTIKIKGKVGSQAVTILIDSGATHSFLDPRIAKEAQLQIVSAPIMEVAVANGECMYNNQICKGFSWEMQGNHFSYSPRMLKLGGCDLVLGGDWLSIYSPILFDFKLLKISFKNDGQQIEICGIKEEANLKSMSATKLHKLFKHKELLAILLAVDKWRHYLELAHFFILTDHQPLKHLLDQRLSTHLQRKAIRKLLGLSYSIVYKKGSENKVADALSRRDEVCAITAVEPQWMMDIVSSYESDQHAAQLIASTAIASSQNYTLTKGVLRFKGRIYVGNATSLRSHLMYAQVCNKQDISFAIGMWLLSDYSRKYLQGTKKHMLTFRHNDYFEVVGNTNTFFSGCVDLRKITFGYRRLFVDGCQKNNNFVINYGG
ncbi:hypothetical protein V2J09_000622 [Rumex salicifolius]